MRAVLALFCLGLCVLKQHVQGDVEQKGDDYEGPEQPNVANGAPLPDFQEIDGRKIPILYDSEGRPLQPPINVVMGGEVEDVGDHELAARFNEAVRRLNGGQPPLKVYKDGEGQDFFLFPGRGKIPWIAFKNTTSIKDGLGVGFLGALLGLSVTAICAWTVIRRVFLRTSRHNDKSEKANGKPWSSKGPRSRRSPGISTMDQLRERVMKIPASSTARPDFDHNGFGGVEGSQNLTAWDRKLDAFC